jgi:hypothetical protein
MRTMVRETHPTKTESWTALRPDYLARGLGVGSAILVSPRRAQ